MYDNQRQEIFKENKMASFKKFEVEIGTNGHIKYKGKIIAVLAQWNKFENLEKPTKRVVVK